MSIYKELNEANIDVSEYVEDELTSEQLTKWKKRVLKKISKNKSG